MNENESWVLVGLNFNHTHISAISAVSVQRDNQKTNIKNHYKDNLEFKKCGVFLSDCYSERKNCGVEHPKEKICKDIKDCACWIPALGCNGIGVRKK